jgi:hypothetical protein
MADRQNEDLSVLFANLRREPENAEALKNHCKQFRDQNPGVPRPDFNGIWEFDNLLPEEKYYWTDLCRLNIKQLDQESAGVLLQVCSWNPNPGTVDYFKEADAQAGADIRPRELKKQKCLYGTLRVMAPDVLCLQETIWIHKNFLEELLTYGKKKIWPGQNTQYFVFPDVMTPRWSKDDKEAGILYNPAKFEVAATANQVDEDWRRQVESIRNRPGKDNAWRQRNTDKKLENRTVALQGKVVSTNTQIIIISIHVVFTGYSPDQRLTLSSEIVSEAQELANDNNMTVFLVGDWNCQVKNIKLTAGAVMPKPLNPFNDKIEDDGIDSVILINPTAGAAGARARAGPARAGPARAGPARAGPAAAGAAAAGANGPAEAGPTEARPEPPKLKLDNVQFFKWSDNVTAADMGGELQPAAIDRIYRRGGHHRPIVANVKIELEPVVVDNLANNAN